VPAVMITMIATLVVVMVMVTAAAVI